MAATKNNINLLDLGAHLEAILSQRSRETGDETEGYNRQAEGIDDNSTRGNSNVTAFDAVQKGFDKEGNSNEKDNQGFEEITQKTPDDYFTRALEPDEV
ncbi:hypothetical protein ILUMI_13804 [Ignelater luminosus]|uniref:Uncharacterized protein n=1 Tax=Ignelater luminosus TaxID=2038154 RepID=A0A8K0CX38_IGNLU|nr:hypothetical protein ILUMI_13804 [Ignelater luminosus]